jgi:hypothetical protein
MNSDSSTSKAAASIPLDGWEVVLLVDVQELKRSKKGTLEWFLASLKDKIRCEVRGLPVGDYIWVARSGNMEIILDWVVERKTTQNLIISLQKKSVKYSPLLQMHVQLLKMKNSRIPNIVLLVEKSTWCRGKDGCYRQAGSYLKELGNSPDSDIIVEQTKSLQGTIDFLVAKHHQIDCATVANGRLRNPPTRPYFTFEKLKANVKDGFNRDDFKWELKLRQLPRLGTTRIKTIMTSFQTKASLKEAFQNDQEGTIKLLAGLNTAGGDKRPRSLGSKIANVMFDAFAAGDWDSDTDTDRTTANVARAPVARALDSDSGNDSDRTLIVAAHATTVSTKRKRMAKPLTIDLLDSGDDSDDAKLPATVSPEAAGGSSIAYNNSGNSKRPRALFPTQQRLYHSQDDLKQKSSDRHGSSDVIEILSDDSSCDDVIEILSDSS